MIRYVLMGVLLAGPALAQPADRPMAPNHAGAALGEAMEKVIQSYRKHFRPGETVTIPGLVPIVSELCDMTKSVYRDGNSVICVLAPERR